MHSVIAGADRHQLPVTVHTASFNNAVDAIEAGAVGLEHGVALEKLSENQIGILAGLAKQKSVFYVPTLSMRLFLHKRKGLVDPQHNLNQLYRQGVKVAVGTDTFGSMKPGATTIRELELMTEAGMRPTDVLQAATRNGAELLGLLTKIGTVEQGKTADLVIVDGDLSTNISDLRKIVKTIQDGKIVYSKNGTGVT